MGHALGDTIEDIFTRWQRMARLQRHVAAGHRPRRHRHPDGGRARAARRPRGKSRHDLGREEFVERVWEWRQRTGDRIFEQLKRLGCSLDWERARLHHGPALLGGGASRRSCACYEEGLIYRARRLINWCPDCRTALSDLEVDYDEGTQGELYEFAYPLADGSGEVVVATTRPETMLGDTAVAVHPDDPRHQAKIGKMVAPPVRRPRVPDHRRRDPGRSRSSAPAPSR